MRRIKNKEIQVFLFCSNVDLTDIDADPRACWPGSDTV